MGVSIREDKPNLGKISNKTEVCILAAINYLPSHTFASDTNIRPRDDASDYLICWQFSQKVDSYFSKFSANKN